MIRERINEIVFDMYMEGFTDGQFAMIRTMKDLGLINDTMAELIAGMITGTAKLDEHFKPGKESRAEIDAATELIMRL